MNPFRRLWCRMYQGAFRLALPLLPYREPELLSSVKEAAQVIRSQGLSHPLIITDRGITALGLTARLAEALAAQHLAFTCYDGTVPNPTLYNVEEARLRYLEEGCDCLIALGGGSSMDCAKITGARLAKPRQSVRQMRGLLKIRRALPLLLAIPTTAGTGSEATLAAVITDSETHFKYPINDFSLIPRYAVLDEGLTLGLPPSLTAATGMDALTHGVEAYIGRSTTRHTRAMAEEAVALIRQYLPIAYADGHNRQARAKMLRAAYCAGVAFTQSYVGYVHGIAHSLGGQYGIPHGLANAVILPYVLKAYGERCYPRLGQLARRCGVAGGQASDEEAAQAFIAWVAKMSRAMGLPEKLTGIRREDIPLLAARADRESNPLYPVPRLMDRRELAAIYLNLISEEAPL